MKVFKVGETRAIRKRQIAVGICTASIFGSAALQILWHGDEVNLEASSLLLVCIAMLCIYTFAALYARRQNSYIKPESTDNSAQILIWPTSAFLLGVPIAIIVIGLMTFSPFDRTTKQSILAFLLVAGIIILTLKEPLKRYRETRHPGPLTLAAFGTASYSLAIICVFERESFAHLPLIFQTNLPAIFDYSYAILALLVTGVTTTTVGRRWEARLRVQD